MMGRGLRGWYLLNMKHFWDFGVNFLSVKIFQNFSLEFFLFGLIDLKTIRVYNTALLLK